MLIQLFFCFFNFAAFAFEEYSAPQPVADFIHARRIVINTLSAIDKQELVLIKSDLIQKIVNLREAYGQLDRQALDPEWLYEAQFQLRFTNERLKNFLVLWSHKKWLSVQDRQEIEFEARTLNDKNQTFYSSPQKELPIEGVKGSDWPLKRWESDPEFYRYQFDGDYVLFRGMRLRAGDILLNHPIEKPVGIFTAVAEAKSVFSHGAMIVFRHNKWGRLPVVVDVHERGVRAVPLHHYFGSKVLGYGEIFRMQNTPKDFEQRIDRAIKHLMSEEHPYDLTGSEDRKALSCIEMISYVLELMGEPKLLMRTQIRLEIFKNILRWGKIAQQKFQTPNDVFQDQRFAYVGYFDNTISLETQVSNEVLLDWFRDKMEQKIVKTKKDLSRFFGEVAIDQMRNKRSLFGGFLLGVTGFNRENFPAGDRGILSAVNAIDHVFRKAMDRCLIADARKASFCFTALRQSMINGLERYDYSIRRWKSDSVLREASARELKDFDNMFE